MRISDWSSDVCSSDLIDGLLLTGSPSNVEPERYGEGDAADAEGPYDPDRDTMTANLVAACLDLGKPVFGICRGLQELNRSEEHTSELQSLMRNSYAVFCLKKKNYKNTTHHTQYHIQSTNK